MSSHELPSLTPVTALPLAWDMAHAEKPGHDKLISDSRRMDDNEKFATGMQAGEAAMQAYYNYAGRPTGEEPAPPDTDEPALLTIYSPLEAATSVSADEITEQIKNRLHLGEAINDVTRPYATLFHLQLPAADSKPRQPLMSRLRQKEPTATWDTRKVVDNLELAFNGTTSYKPDTARNQPTVATVDIRNIDDGRVNPSSAIRFIAEFGDTTIERIKIRGYYGYTNDTVYVGDNYSRQVLGMPAFGDTTASSAPINTIGDFLNRTVAYAGSVDIDLTGERPCITVTHPHASIGSYQYRYDATEDRFNLIGLSTYISNDSSRPPLVRPSSLSRDEFLSIVKSTFSLVPASESKV